MMMLRGCLLLAPMILFSAALLRRIAAERDPWVLASGSVGLSGVLLILGGALLLPWVGPGTCLGLVAALCALGSWWLLRSPGSVADLVTPSPQGRGTLLALVCGLPGLGLTLFFSLFIMSVSLVVDDGFFLHTSNMGMILAGHYPPLSFLGEPLQGHIGKDLLTALLALAFNTDFLQAEWISTCAIQVCHFLFLLTWLRAETGQASYALMGTYFAFVGSSFGAHLGLADTITNNNAVAFFTLSLCSYLLRRWLRLGTWQLALLAGAVLGSDAIIYELHFGLLGLTLFLFTLPRRERYRGFGTLVGTALLLASCEGGAITHLVHKMIAGPAAYQQDAQRSYQSQTVNVRFPKAELFRLRRDNLRPSRFFETRLRPAEADFTPSRLSAPLWSPQILSCFWYPVWLAPLVLLGLWVGRNGLAGWFFCLGFFSVLTPCVVSFGYFENETGRWFFGAALGFSVAYALGVAQLCSTCSRWRYPGWVIMAWTVWFNFPAIPLRLGEMRACLAQPGTALPDGSPGIVPGTGLIPQPRRSLAHHYQFTEADWKLAERLRRLGQQRGDFPRARYLVNYPDDAPPTNGQDVELASGGMLNRIGLQTGLSGLLPAGISSAPRNRWCAPTFSQTLQARAFWSDPQLWRLSHLSVAWLVVNDANLAPEVARTLAASPHLKEVYRDGERSILEVERLPNASPAAQKLNLRAVDSPRGPLRPRQPYRLSCPLQERASGSAQILLRYLALDSPTGDEANPDDLLSEQLEPGQLELHLIGPYFPGHYQLEWMNQGDSQWRPLVKLKFD